LNDVLQYLMWLINIEPNRITGEIIKVSNGKYRAKIRINGMPLSFNIDSWSNIDNALDDISLKLLETLEPEVVLLLSLEHDDEVKMYDMLNRIYKSKDIKKISGALSNVGVYHSEKKEYESAINKFNQALEIDISNKIAITNLSSTLFTMKKYDEILSNRNKYDKYAEDYSLYMMNIGMVYYKKQNFVEAKRYLSRSIKLDPYNSDAYFNLGFVYQNHNYKNPDLAIKNFKKAISTDSSNWKAYINLAAEYSQMGLEKDALSVYYDAITNNPTKKEEIRLMFRPDYRVNQ